MHEIFKGLLFLHGYVNAAELLGGGRQRVGAKNVEVARSSGNRGAARQWFGPRAAEPGPAACRDACA